MRIALIGASGFVGSRILAESLRRQHRVSALVRHPQRLAAQPNMTAVAADVFDRPALVATLRGHDALISAYNPGHDASANPNLYRDIVEGSLAILDSAKRAEVAYTVYIGGAGSLQVAPSLMLADDPGFPAKYDQHVPEALKHFAKQKAQSIDVPRAGRISQLLFQGDHSFNWSFISPPLYMEPGVRTGQYRDRGDEFPWDTDRPAGISIEDLAVAVLDECEQRRHLHQHFTVTR